MTEYLKSIPILLKLLRYIVAPIDAVIYMFTYNPLIIDCHYSVVYPLYKSRIRWSESTPLYDGLTFHPKDFDNYTCATHNFRTCIHKRHMIGFTLDFDIISIDDYIGF